MNFINTFAKGIGLLILAGCVFSLLGWSWNTMTANGKYKWQPLQFAAAVVVIYLIGRYL